MKKLLLTLLWTVFIPFISPSGTLLFAQSGFGGPFIHSFVGGPDPNTPQDPPPPVITNPGNPPAVLTYLTNPFTGATITGHVSVDPFGGSIEVYLLLHGHVIDASITNHNIGCSYAANYFTDSHVSFPLHGNGYYEIRITTNHGDYYGYIAVNSLPGLQVPGLSTED